MRCCYATSYLIPLALIVLLVDLLGDSDEESGHLDVPRRHDMCISLDRGVVLSEICSLFF